MKPRLGVSDALYLKPLLFGLDKPDSSLDLFFDVPAKNALKLSERSEGIRSAFLSPIDYARHGGEYCIIPTVCAASSVSTNTIQLFLKSEINNIDCVAVDVRFTSEIVLANIILKEKYRNEPSHQNIQFIPMMPDIDAMLVKADAALLVNEVPSNLMREGIFAMDLVEEWNDMTDLPYLHGFWVGREGELLAEEARALVTAKKDGVLLRNQIAESIAQQKNLSLSKVTQYISNFSYDFGKQEEESFAEFMHYAFYHGVISDVPEIQFFDLESDEPSRN